jgi:hypothetical protein
LAEYPRQSARVSRIYRNNTLHDQALGLGLNGSRSKEETMKLRVLTSALAGFVLVATSPALAWFHAGDEGGHWHATYAGPGGFAHAGGTAGYGWHGSAAGWGGGYHGYGYGGWGYHQPVTVNHYYGGGCWNCGYGGAVAAGEVGLAAGAAVGAAAASANTANAYAAGVAAGSAYAIGATYAALPGGCYYSPVGGTAYYNCRGSWLQPAYGSNGVYYQVVPIP